MRKPLLPASIARHARRLPVQMTDAERKLRLHLRAGRLDGLKFRRQHPVAPFIADFACIEQLLIVELDGSQHNEATDADRTRYLHSMGWRLLRFWNDEALMKTDDVLQAIWDAARKPALTPTPLPAGEGLPSES